MGLPGLERDDVLWLDLAGLGPDLLALLAAEIDELESVLGCTVRLGERRDDDAAWLVRARETDVPSLEWDRRTRTLVSQADSSAEVMATMQVLHSVVRSQGSRVEHREPSTTTDAARLVHDVVLGSFPSFGLRGIDRGRWAGRVDQAPASWEEFTPWAQAWVAELGDAHTAVIAHAERGWNPPYVGSLTESGVVLERVPDGSPAWDAGVRDGWIVAVADPARWLRTTGASPQQHARVAARRALAVPGERRELDARAPGGDAEVSWWEEARAMRLEDVLQVRRDGDTLRVRLGACAPGLGIEEAFDDLCAGAEPSARMELDLRGNTGGDLHLALGLRDRFLRGRTRIGSIAFSTGTGTLAPVRERWAEPSGCSRWPGALTVAVDSMTYSAAEDLVLGLQGLPHVRVVGERTGGGSGRPLALPLGPGLTLRVSTAITYDRDGDPVELRGLVPG